MCRISCNDFTVHHQGESHTYGERIDRCHATAVKAVVYRWIGEGGIHRKSIPDHLLVPSSDAVDGKYSIVVIQMAGSCMLIVMAIEVCCRMHTWICDNCVCYTED